VLEREIRVGVTVELREQIRVQAAREGLTSSAWVRRLIVRAIPQPSPSMSNATVRIGGFGSR
jgi:hypothetical protein